MSRSKNSTPRFKRLLETMDGMPNPQVKAIHHRGGGGAHIKNVNKINRRKDRMDERRVARGGLSED